MKCGILVYMFFAVFVLFTSICGVYSESSDYEVDSNQINDVSADSSTFDAGQDTDATETFSEGDVSDTGTKEPAGYYDAEGNFYSTETEDAGSSPASSKDVDLDIVNINDVPEDAEVQPPSFEDNSSSTEVVTETK